MPFGVPDQDHARLRRLAKGGDALVALGSCVPLRDAANVFHVQALEAALGAVSIFARLRPDEIGQVARHFQFVELDEGNTYFMSATAEESRLVVVVSGMIDAVLGDPAGHVHERMHPGDRYGEAMLLTGNPQAVQLRAKTRCALALLDKVSLDAILFEFPAVALPLAAELASELRTRNDQVRRVLELTATGLNKKYVDGAVRQLKRNLVRRSAGIRHLSTGGLFRRLVVARGAEPPFWMLVGFLCGLSGARLVVHLILKYKLEKQLFALVAGAGPNPMHIHHFNYGLILVSVTGLAALSPLARRALRTLALMFGLGCGLVFDEFALFWNLNPNYSQSLSLISAAIAAIVFVQIAFFRRFWLAVLARIVPGVRAE